MMIPTKIIKNPRITEKAADASARNAYVFDVTASANKTEIRKAILEVYKVKPIRINILAVPSKQIFAKGRKGVKSGGRKAIVYLKEGDKIEFV
ncbi:MAG: 50S ribosomal protein L23 [Candidatus Pacebacteria bacterium]|nr:50S ribosomal protein L23 [Candidatus Paceibacterota bacterium]MCF7862491.1 50S ribosomal protein L23 [Candidatus Paceibacterota bacterium]